MDDIADLPSAAAPAIFNLHDDLLLHIFQLNTYTAETEYPSHIVYTSSNLPRSLTIARLTSHVCRAWRQTILASPAIWASLIDMTIIEASSEFWAEEVLKRTGEADLSLYGWLGRRSVAFFTSLLDNNWHRVRRFDISVSTYIEGDRWAVVCGRPAPRLEKFLLEGGYQHFRSVSRGESDGPWTIFGNFAPSLRRFHCTQIVINSHRETWISQLSSLTLSSPLNTIDVLRILGITVHLESLIIMDPVSAPATDWNKNYLPKLVHLHIAASISQCLLFLQNIVGHPDCTLVLYAVDREDVSADDFDLLLNIITAYTAQYMVIHQPQRLMIHVGGSDYWLETVKGTDMKYFAHPETLLFFLFGYDSLHKMVASWERVMSALSSISLGCIVELQFNNSRFPRDDEYSPGLIRLIKSLSSVNTLIVKPDFKFLSSLIQNSPHILPLLKAIQLKGRIPINVIDSNASDIKHFPLDMLLFLSQRKVAGMPVTTLEITDGAMGSIGRYDWRFLDDVEGLKVIWRRDSKEFEYICGSGEKERLNWS